MIVVMACFFRYIAVLVEEDTKALQWARWFAMGFFIAVEIAVMLLPVQYTETAQGNYCSGLIAGVCYVSVSFYLVLCAVLLVKNWKTLGRKKKKVIGIAFTIASRIFVIVIRIKSRPSINTAVRANCHEYPIPIQTV